MNAQKFCFTIYSSGSKSDLEFDLLLNGESIPYNPNPVFLDVTFNGRITFKIFALERSVVYKNNKKFLSFLMASD